MSERSTLGRFAAALALAVLACAPTGAQGPASRTAISLGPIAGDVTPTSAVLWARAAGAARLVFEIEPGDAELPASEADAATDFTASVLAEGLRPDSEYQVRVRADGGAPAEGRFRTAPAASSTRPLRLAWSGDLAGLNVCRDQTRGFPVFDALVRYAPDLFIALGDMIYADHPCKPIGRYGNPQIPGDFAEASTLASYWAHWRYTREDPGFARMLATTPYLAIWDDHEVVNDAGPLHDTRSAAPYTEGVHLLPIGMRAFLDYNAIALDEERTPGRLYRSFRWGRHVELFVLDTRQYRDANLAPDPPPAPADAVGEIRRAKSLLGREQRIWLERRLLASDATWKVIVSSVPLGLATGTPPERGRDGWAPGGGLAGFTRERDEILGFLSANGLRSTLWITTDVHFAEVFVYRPMPEDPSFRVLEAVSGPLSAALGTPRDADPQLRPEVKFLYGTSTRPASFEEAARFFNFGALEVDAAGGLTIRIVDAEGATRYAGRFEP